MQSIIRQVETKTTKTGKTFYSVTYDGGKESTWDKGFVGTEGKNVEFDIEVKGDYKNLKFGKIIESSAPSAPPAPAPAPEPVKTAPGDRLMSLRLECVKLAIQTRDLADVSPDKVGYARMIAIAEKYFGYIVNGPQEKE